jgi:hypothetical protein
MRGADGAAVGDKNNVTGPFGPEKRPRDTPPLQVASGVSR